MDVAVDTQWILQRHSVSRGRPRRELKMFVWFSHEECREAHSKLGGTVHVKYPTVSKTRYFDRHRSPCPGIEVQRTRYEAKYRNNLDRSPSSSPRV